jgi:hypothetical protein
MTKSEGLINPPLSRSLFKPSHKHFTNDCLTEDFADINVGKCSNHISKAIVSTDTLCL